MGIDFYYFEGSAPCCSVMMVAEVLGLDLNLIKFNYMNNDHLQPEFLKINPLHTLPTIVDNGFVLWESRAINLYLAEKYAKKDSFYPKDIEKRATVNQLMFNDFELYQKFADYFFSQLMNQQPADSDCFKKITDILAVIEKSLQGKTFLAGDEMTVADVAFSTSLAIFNIFRIDLNKYEKMSKYFKHCSTVIPGFQKMTDRCAEILQRYVDEVYKE